MSPSRRVRLSALLAIVVAMLGSVSLSSADEFLDEFRASMNVLPDPTIRSPRLLGMGRLTLVVDEANNGLSLWDFAQMPAGLGDADSISVLELRQTTAAASTLHDILGLRSERQSFAARDALLGVDAWRRAAGETTFGLTGDFSLLRTDEPFAQTIEERNEFSRPTLVPAVNGPMPYILSDRMRYGLRGIYAIENRREEYRAFVTNPFGEYADQNGLLLNAPDQFSPIETEVSTTGFGGSARYDFGQWLQAGLGFDATKARIRSQNTGLRHGTFYEEDRPTVLGQAVVHGAGPHFEWIADGRRWTSTSEPSWRYTTSAGQGSNPLSGRGKLLERDETGSLVRSRARLFSGDFELGGSFSVGTRTIEITPPDPSDRSSFNYFRNITYLRLNADSIALPDSITADEVERRSMEAGFGASWRSPWRGALIGVEYHMAESEDERLSGTGPKRVFWDVRTGVELPLVAEALIGRAGFIYRTDDLDDLTENNEFVSNAVTLGLGVRPAGRTWTFESGYAYEWFRGDYPDPTQTRGTRNQFNMQVRWDL
jgi:hypothetical protein